MVDGNRSAPGAASEATDAILDGAVDGDCGDARDASSAAWLELSAIVRFERSSDAVAEAEARIISFEGGRIGLFLGEFESGRPEVGTEVELEFTGASLTSPIRTRAEVRYRDDLGAGSLYGLQLCTWPTFLEALPERLRRSIDRRSSARVALELPDRRVEVSWGSDAACSAHAALEDLSLDGLSFSWSLAEAGPPEGCETARVSFRLPTTGEVVTFTARVRYREMRGERMRCGVVFEADSSPEFEAQRDALRSYVGSLDVAFEDFVV